MLLQPGLHQTDWHKIMVTVEHLEGSKKNVTDSPKQWSRIELRFANSLMDNWPAFRDRLWSDTKILNLGKTSWKTSIIKATWKHSTAQQRFEHFAFKPDCPKQFGAMKFSKALFHSQNIGSLRSHILIEGLMTCWLTMRLNLTKDATLDSVK